MHSFIQLSEIYEQQFSIRHFPPQPATLYDSAQYILGLKGKRIRPASVLMGNELFTEIKPDAFFAANAIELFHNFSLIHDDIMDKAPLRRGMETVHTKYGESTALLAGDVMLIKAYEYINQIHTVYLQKVLSLFNQTAKEVCEGQQLDMDFENMNDVNMEEYLHMIELKTSVLLGASLKAGAILARANEADSEALYAFGKNLGIAFQVQDDYLDAFGNAEKFGKQIGGDIMANKKTFLLIHSLEVASTEIKNELFQIMKENPSDKVERIKAIMKSLHADQWVNELKETYFQKALHFLDKISVPVERKEPLRNLALFMIQRDY